MSPSRQTGRRPDCLPPAPSHPATTQSSPGAADEPRRVSGLPTAGSGAPEMPPLGVTPRPAEQPTTREFSMSEPIPFPDAASREATRVADAEPAVEPLVEVTAPAAEPEVVIGPTGRPMPDIPEPGRRHRHGAPASSRCATRRAASARPRPRSTWARRWPSTAARCCSSTSTRRARCRSAWGSTPTRWT